MARVAGASDPNRSVVDRIRLSPTMAWSANDGTRLTQALKKIRSICSRFSWPTPVTPRPEVRLVPPSTARK